MPGRPWRMADDGPGGQAEPNRSREVTPPRIRVVTRGLAVALLGAVAFLCYLVDRSPPTVLAKASCVGLGGFVETVAFADAGRMVVARTSDGSLTRWDPVGGRRQTIRVGRGTIVVEAAITSDGSLAAVPADGEAAVLLWDVAASRRRAVLPVCDRERVVLAFSRDGAILAVADRAGIRIWEARTGRLRTVAPPSLPRARALVFAPDGRTLAVRAEDGTIQLWDAAAGAERILYRADRLATAPLAFADDGHVLAFADCGGRAELREVVGGRRLAVLEAGSQCCSQAFAPGGRILATACNDGRVRLWDTMSGRLVRVVPVSDDPITAVAFSPDGRELACGLYGGIRLVPIEELPNPSS